MSKTKIQEATELIPSGATLFCCASYESRSASLPVSVAERTDINLVLFSNEEFLKDTAVSRGKILNAFSGRSRLVRLRKRNPIITADILSAEFQAVKDNLEICIDISTFTREAIFFMVRIIDDLGLYRQIPFFLYARERIFAQFEAGSRMAE